MAANQPAMLGQVAENVSTIFKNLDTLFGDKSGAEARAAYKFKHEQVDNFAQSTAAELHTAIREMGNSFVTKKPTRMVAEFLQNAGVQKIPDDPLEQQQLLRKFGSDAIYAIKEQYKDIFAAYPGTSRYIDDVGKSVDEYYKVAVSKNDKGVTKTTVSTPGITEEVEDSIHFDLDSGEALRINQHGRVSSSDPGAHVAAATALTSGQLADKQSDLFKAAKKLVTVVRENDLNKKDWKELNSAIGKLGDKPTLQKQVSNEAQTVILDQLGKEAYTGNSVLMLSLDSDIPKQLERFIKHNADGTITLNYDPNKRDDYKALYEAKAMLSALDSNIEKGIAGTAKSSFALTLMGMPNVFQPAEVNTLASTLYDASTEILKRRSNTYKALFEAIEKGNDTAFNQQFLANKKTLYEDRLKLIKAQTEFGYLATKSEAQRQLAFKSVDSRLALEYSINNQLQKQMPGNVGGVLDQLDLTFNAAKKFIDGGRTDPQLGAAFIGALRETTSMIQDAIIAFQNHEINPSSSDFSTIANRGWLMYVNLKYIENTYPNFFTTTSSTEAPPEGQAFKEYINNLESVLLPYFPIGTTEDEKRKNAGKLAEEWIQERNFVRGAYDNVLGNKIKKTDKAKWKEYNIPAPGQVEPDMPLEPLLKLSSVLSRG